MSFIKANNDLAANEIYNRRSIIPRPVMNQVPQIMLSPCIAYIPPLSIHGNIQHRNPQYIPVSRHINSNIAVLAIREYQVGNYDASESLCHQWIAESGETAQCLLLLATIYMKLHKFDKANQYSDKAMVLNAALVEPYIFKGLISREKGQIIDAMNYFHVALQIKPESADAYVGLANCYLALNDIESAIQNCYMALQKQPESLLCRHELANMLKIGGRLEEAKICYEKVLEKKIDYAPAWLNLGYIHLSLGSTWLALHHFEKTIQYDPYILDSYLAYGNVLKDLKLNDRATQLYLKALVVFPSSPLVLGNLAGAYHEQGLLDLAIETYRQAITILPNYPDAYCNLANALKEKGSIAEAEHFYNIAISLCPTHADSYNNLANIYREQGKVKESIDMYNKALEISPNFAAAHSNIATVLQQSGNINEAIVHYQKAVQANPGYAEGHCYLGNAYKEVANYKSAIECYSRALQINSLSPEAHAYLATAYKDIGSIPEAIITFKTALKFRPNFPEVFCNLMHCYQLTCDWDDYNNRMQKLVSIVADQLTGNRPPSVHPHHTMLYPLSPEQRKNIAARHAVYCIDRINFLGIKTQFTFPKKLEKGAKIKIGYVSSDFCNHPTSHLIQSIPGLHDKSKFEIYCYSLIANDDSSFRKKIEREVDHFVDLSSITSPGDAANVIYEDGIHILLNLNGYTKGARNEIFALKPAPIQTMYLGYPGTSGSTYMDYIITDPITSPIEHASHYSEKLAYMPHTYFIGDHANLFPHVLKDLTQNNYISKIVGLSDQQLPSAKTTNIDGSKIDLSDCVNETNINTYITYFINKRKEEQKGSKDCGERVPDLDKCLIERKTFGIPTNSFIFCNFNQLYKLDPSTFLCWCRILKRVPNSILWLLRFPKAGEINLKETASKYGLPLDRIIFTEVASKEEHVRRGQLADICLDTPLCNGHTTGMDVLWAGCPIITLPLNSFASRVASSLMATIGCSELITSSLEEYEELAVKLATDQSYYAKIKSKIWFGRVSSPLFNVKTYAANLDSLFIKMWNKYEEKTDTDHIL